MPENEENKIRASTDRDLLIRLITKLEYFENTIAETKTQQKSLGEIEKNQAVMKNELDEIKKTINKPKASWWQIAGGISSIGSLIIVLTIVIPIVNSGV